MEFVHRLLTLSLAIVQFPFPSSGKATTCTAGDFAVGQNASLMCFFPDDIDAHDSVYIVHYPFSAPTDASDVLLCKLSEVKSSTCKGKDGVALTRYTRNTLFVQIVNVTEHAMGSYMCQFVPPDLSPRDLCNLTVHGAVTPASAGNRQSTTIVEKRESSTDANAGETGTNSVGVIVGVIVALLVLAGVIILVIFIMRRHRNRRMKTRSADSADGTRSTTTKLLNESTLSQTTGSVGKRDIESHVSVERTAAPPPVQDDCEGIGGANYTEQKSPDTDTPIDAYLLGRIEIDNNSSYNFEKSEIPSSPTTDGEVVLLTQLYKLMQSVKTKAEALEEGKRSRASYAGTSNDSQTSRDFKNSFESGARLQRQAESRAEPVDVEPVISCVEQILNHVERGQVDEQKLTKPYAKSPQNLKKSPAS